MGKAWVGIVIMMTAAVLLVGCQGIATSTTASTELSTGAATTPLTIINAQGKRVALEVELAVSPQQIMRGLQERRSLPPNQGMLFDFSSFGESVTIPFYMKDTYIPLSIAFISPGGEIIDIQDMEPLSEDLHHPAIPYRYTLEVNQGFFQRNSIGVGSRVQSQWGY